MEVPVIRELSIGEILRSSLHLYRRYFTTNLLAYAIPNLPGAIVYAYGTHESSIPIMALALLLLIPGSFVSYTAITLCVSDACAGNKPSLKRSLLRTRAVAGSLMAVFTLEVLLIVAGFIALVVPGAILMGWYFFAPITVILEGRSGKAALRRSRALGKGFYLRNWAILILGMVPYCAIYVIGVIILMLVSAGMTAAGMSSSIVGAAGAFMGEVLGFVASPLIFIVLVVTYYDLRARKEAFDNLVLAAELAR